MAENTVGIEIKVKGSANFSSALRAIKKPVDDLNSSLQTLTKTINQFGGGLGRIQKGSLSGLANELSALGRSARTLRGGNLTGLRNTVNAVQSMMRLLNDPNLRIQGNVAQRVRRWQQFRRLLRSLADAMKAFDRIKRPQNIQAAGDGIQAIRKALTLLTNKKFQDKIRTATRSTLFRDSSWRRLKNIVRHIANALKAFDRLRRPQNAAAAASAMNSLSRLLTTLSKIAQDNQKLAQGGLKGLFSQSGFLAEGLPRFITVIANAIRAFGRLPKGTGTNVRNVATFIRAISKLMEQLSGTVGIQGLRETAKGLDAFITSLAKSMRKFRGIPKINAGGFTKLFQGFAQFRKQGDLKKIDKEVGAASGSILATLTSLPQKLLSGFVNPFKRIFSGLGSGVVTFGRTVTEGVQSALRAVANIGGPLLRLAKNAGQAIARVIGRAIKLGLNTLRFGRNLFQGIVDQARRAGQEIARSFRATGRELQRIGRTFTQAGLGLLVGGGIAGVIQSRQVALVADFESLIKQIEVLGGVTGKELEQANKFILDLGESSVFSATEVSAAFLDLVKSGLDVNDTMAALPAIMDLAAAGQVGVADASSLAIAAIKSFNLEFADSARVADAFVAAANVGTAEVSDLASAFPFAASQANAFGQELETTLAAITLLIDTGQPASNAGRGLASLFTALIDPAEEAEGALDFLAERLELFLPKEVGGSGAFSLTAEEMDALGLSMDDFAEVASGAIDLVSDTEGNFRDLDSIVALLSVSTRGLTEDQRALYLTSVAGSQNAGRVLLSLVNAFENGQGSIADYEEKMNESSSAAEVGAALMDTFKGSIEELSGAFETLLIKGLIPVIEFGLRPLVDFATSVVRAISSLPDEVLALVSAGLLLIPVLATIAGSFLLLTGLNLQLLGAAFTIIGGALTALLNPLRAIIILTAGQGIILAALGAGIFLIPAILAAGAVIARFVDTLRQSGLAAGGVARTFDEIRASIERAVGGISDALDAFFNVLGTAGNENVSAVTTLEFAFSTLGNGITKVIDDIGMFARAFEQALLLISTPAETVAATFETISGSFAGNTFFESILGEDFTAQDIAQWAVNVQSAILGVRDVLDESVFVVARFFQTLNNGGSVGEAFGGLLQDLESMTLRLSGAFIELFESAFGLDFGGLGDVLALGDTSAIWEAYGEELMTALIRGSIRILQSIGGVFADLFDTLFGTNIAPVLDRFFEILQDGVTPFFNFVQSIAAFVRGPVSRQFVRFIDTIARQIPIIRKALADVVYFFGIWQRMIELVGAQQATVNMATILFGPNATDDAEFVIDLLWELADSIAFAFDQIRDVLRGDISVGEFLQDFATLTLDDLVDLGRFAFDEFADDILHGLRVAWDTALSVAGFLFDVGVEQLFNLADAAGIDLTPIITALRTAWDAALSVAGYLFDVAADQYFSLGEGDGGIVNTLIARIRAAWAALVEPVLDVTLADILTFPADVSWYELRAAIEGAWETVRVNLILPLNLADHLDIALGEGTAEQLQTGLDIIGNAIGGLSTIIIGIPLTIFGNFVGLLAALQDFDWPGLASGIGLVAIAINALTGGLLVLAAISLGAQILALGALAITLLFLAAAVNSFLRGFRALFEGERLDVVLREFVLGFGEVVALALDALGEIFGLEDGFFTNRLNDFGDFLSNFADDIDIIFKTLWLKMKLGVTEAVADILGRLNVIGDILNQIPGVNVNFNVREGLNQDIEELEAELDRLLADKPVTVTVETKLDFDVPTEEDADPGNIFNRALEAALGGFDFGDLPTSLPGLGGFSLIPPETVDATVDAGTEAAGGFTVVAEEATKTAETTDTQTDAMTVSMTEFESALEAVTAAAGLDLDGLKSDMVSTAQVIFNQSTLMVNALGKVGKAIDDLHVKVVSKSALIKTELAVLRTAWVLEFATMEQSVRSLAATIGGLTGNYNINIAPGTPTTSPPPGRASGGSVFAGNLYEVAEEGISELLRIGGNTYLIPGENGLVIPAQTATPYSQDTSALGLRGGAGVGGGYVDQSMVINEGDVTITVSGASGDVDEITSGVREQIDAANAERNREMASRLRAAGR